jgi:hypothetical protein
VHQLRGAREPASNLHPRHFQGSSRPYTLFLGTRRKCKERADRLARRLLRVLSSDAFSFIGQFAGAARDLLAAQMNAGHLVATSVVCKIAAAVRA